MSSIAATGGVSLPQTSAAPAASAAGGQGNGANPATGQVATGSASGQIAGSATATSAAAVSAQSISGSSYSLDISQSQGAFLSSSVSQGLSEADQRVMMLIMALIQILFGGEDDSKNRDAAFGLIGALLQGGSQQSEQFTYFEYSDFHYSESYSEFQSTSVQAASYEQLSSASANAAPASGGNLNVTG
ncbi:MAG TPA: hypothetical protein VJZ71_05110 [Phycisphaerae bacterium]|nr:hypothetical protein [Phycisphaerae bacterium]